MAIFYTDTTQPYALSTTALSGAASAQGPAVLNPISAFFSGMTSNLDSIFGNIRETFLGTGKIKTEQQAQEQQANLEADRINYNSGTTNTIIIVVALVIIASLLIYYKTRK